MPKMHGKAVYYADRRYLQRGDQIVTWNEHTAARDDFREVPYSQLPGTECVQAQVAQAVEADKANRELPVTAPIAKVLLDHFGTIDAVLRAGEDELVSIKGIGISSARKIVAYAKGK